MNVKPDISLKNNTSKNIIIENYATQSADSLNNEDRKSENNVNDRKKTMASNKTSAINNEGRGNGNSGNNNGNNSSKVINNYNNDGNTSFLLIFIVAVSLIIVISQQYFQSLQYEPSQNSQDFTEPKLIEFKPSEKNPEPPVKTPNNTEITRFPISAKTSGNLPISKKPINSQNLSFKEKGLNIIHQYHTNKAALLSYNASNDMLNQLTINNKNNHLRQLVYETRNEGQYYESLVKDIKILNTNEQTKTIEVEVDEVICRYNNPEKILVYATNSKTIYEYKFQQDTKDNTWKIANRIGAQPEGPQLSLDNAKKSGCNERWMKPIPK